MSLSREEIGIRLRHQREVLGYTQKQVAESLGLHRPTISEIEVGRRDVTSQELFEFAKLYVTSLSDLLAEPKPSEENVTTVLFRRPGLETPDARRAVKKFIQRCRDEQELEEVLGVDRGGKLRTSVVAPDPVDTCDAIEQGRKIAERERRNLQLGDEPVRDPLALLEKQGVRIGLLDGGDGVDVDGVYFETEGLGACVGVNPRPDDWTGFRAAFTACHEYAHWVFRDVQVEGFTFGTGATSDLRETRANAFAAAFLMPAGGVKGYFARLALMQDERIPRLGAGDIVRAMDYFGVSRQALLYRLQNLKLFDVEQADQLRQTDYSVRQIAESLGLELRTRRYLATRVPALAIEAWRRGVIGTGRAADLLDREIDEFRDLMNQIGVVQDVVDDDPLLGAAAAP